MKTFAPRLSSRAKGFTLVEIMIVVAIIALLAAIVLPSFIRQRKRTQATSVLEDLRLIDSAVDQYALENGRSLSVPNVPVPAWMAYIKPGSRLYTTSADIFNRPYGDQTLGVVPKVPADTYDSFNDVVDTAFWAPYTRGN